MRKALAIYINITFLLFAANVCAQTSSLNTETLQEKARLYSKINASGLLFVHTDKTLYTNNESIWFAGYLISTGLGKLEDHTLLSVSLMREDDRKIICEQENVMEQGFGNGSLLIPDNTPPGNYIFNAYTNVMDQHGKPTALFSQPVTVKSITKRPFGATLNLLDTVINNGSVRASLVLDIKDEKRKNKPTVTYGLIGGKTQKVVLADTENKVNVTLSSSQLIGADPVLLTQIVYFYDTLYLSVKLPKIQSKGINIRFLPEGGNLTNGLESMVAVETTTKDGLQVPLTGILYNNNEPIDTVSTNSYGIGRFKLNPDIKNTYTFRVKANSYLSTDSVYKLPDVIDNGVLLHFNNAVVNDTLQIALYSKTPKPVQVAIHNYKEIFSVLNTYAYPQGKSLSLVVAGLPKGVATATVLDEQGRPLAERLFFVNYNNKITADVITSKKLYSKRDSVAVTISLKDKEGNPVKGLLSVAAVQENRLESAKEQYIDNYLFLEQTLGKLPLDPLQRGFDDKDYLENMFLTRGWRRYTWQNMVSAKAADTTKIGLPPQFKGKVLYYNYALKKPHSLLTIPTASSVTTNADGTFVLAQQQIAVPEGKKVFLWVNKNNIQGYTISTTNPFYALNSQVAEKIVIAGSGVAKAGENSLEQELSTYTKGSLLHEAHIKADKKDKVLIGADAINDCGDYVCETNYLNCPFDPPFSLPEKGKRYKQVSPLGQELPKVTYEGCTTNGQQITAVYTAKEFYGVNKGADPFLDPQYLSTLFWKPGIQTDEKGEASFSFFTGDIEGRFKIISQGVGSDDVFYGDTEFSVK